MRVSPIVSLPERSLLRVLARCDGINVNPAPMVAALAREFSGEYQHQLRMLAERFAEGSPAVEALAQTPGIVSWPVEALLTVASESGTLPQAYISLLEQDRKQTDEAGIDGETATQMMLRVLLSFFFALLVITFLLLLILPTFEKIFDEFGLELPTPTVLLIAVSNNVASWISFLFFGVVIVLLIRSPTIGRSLWNTWSMMSLGKKPASAAVRSRSLLASAIETGQSIESIVRSLSNGHPNRQMSKRLQNAAARIDQGTDAWTALYQAKILTAREASALSKTRSPESQAWLLDWSAESRQSGQDRKRFALSETLSIVFTLILAFVCGWMAIAVFMPLVDLITGLS